MEHAEIVGKTFEFIYSNETYRIEILTDKKVQWTRTEGENAGVDDEEAYVYSKLHETVGLITWIEADGLGCTETVIA